MKNNNLHLTEEGLKKIKLIKAGKNRGREIFKKPKK